jgi:hypothetical protein
MPKEIYILRSHLSEDYTSFKNRIIRLAGDVVEQYTTESLKACLTVRRPPLISVIPFRKKKIAILSVTRKKGKAIEMITQTEGFDGGYLVEEAVPVAYNKEWADGDPTPGVCLLTLFHKKPGLDQDTFLSRWHNSHTPLSLRIHPLWNYNRNVVTGTMNGDSRWYDGIVEEQFKKSSDLLNPLIFFGPLLKVPLHMYRVLADTRSFIDMRRIETYLAAEFHIKSPVNP